MKEKGVLLPIFSLPSKYGVGDFGNEAYEFIDILADNGITYWEILPINACDRLPYSPISYYALNEAYISIDKLKEAGLIKRIEDPGDRRYVDHAIYDDYKEKYIKRAYNNFIITKEYKEFIKNKNIKEYAEYKALRGKEKEEYYLFEQFILFKQWMAIKEYANNRGIQIIGDMPVYPPFDSVDTEYHKKYFRIKNKKIEFEAGSPPDYFSEDGQKWGSATYNVENIIKDDYKYLTDRYEWYIKLFDKIRVDYFRGYDSFFEIPYGKSGKEGHYQDGVSYGFFDKLFERGIVKKEDLFIEDLGDIREETVRLRDNYGFIRQKILQFTLDLDNLYDRDNREENVLMYPGNHDTQTIYGWYKTLQPYQQENLKEFLKNNNCNNINVNIGIMEYLVRCMARIVIISVQDVLGLDDEARINLPGTLSDKNWSWKLVDFNDFKERIKDFK